MRVLVGSAGACGQRAPASPGRRLCAASQLHRLRTDMRRLHFLALMVALATVPPLASADSSWLLVAPYARWSGRSLELRAETFRAIRSQEGWDDLWRLAAPNPLAQADQSIPAPDVDFTKTLVLVAALGTRPTAGYSVIIQGALDDGAVIHVYVLEVRPNGPDCIAATVITHPVSIALIPRSDRQVRFEISTADLDCKANRSVVDGRSSNNRWRGP